MLNAIELCKIEAISRTGRSYYKYPRLHEVMSIYSKQCLLITRPMGDVLICLRCYGLMQLWSRYCQKRITKLQSLQNVL